MERGFEQGSFAARHIDTEASPSGVVWAPIFAGAIIALATSIILIAVGSGLGFAAASPWPGASPSATSFAVGIGVWLIVTQWLSAALGGFITGRLRTKWTGIHTREVMFRDTAHGLLAWALATAFVAGIGITSASSTVGAANTAASTSASYATDTLLRSDRATSPVNSSLTNEISRTLARDGGASDSDKNYITNVVASQTGLSRAQAQQRVDEAVTNVRQAVDKARKISSAISFFTALSMVIGAFVACAAAAYGGSYRDLHADQPHSL